MKIKKHLAIFLLLVFTNFIVAPTVVSMVDSTADVSMVFSVNEEENKENGFENDVLNQVLQIELFDFSFFNILNKRYSHNDRDYAQLFMQLHPPPPRLS